LGFDSDLPGTTESKIFGRTWWDKALWLGSFWFVQGVIRPLRMKKITFFDRWIFINYAVQATFLAGLFYGYGVWALAYLCLSTTWGIGLHPLERGNDPLWERGRS
jgi:sphingolipid delta-4 desaturase